MRIRNLFIFIISTGIPLFISGHSLVVHIEILGEKKSYLYGEYVVIKSYIWNKGNKEERVIPSFGENRFIIKDVNGKELKRKRRLIISANYTVIPSVAPGETISYIQKAPVVFLPPGEYNVKAYHLIPNNTDNYDTLKSNMIKIKIVDPKGKEKEAFELYKEALHLNKKPTLKESTKKLSQLLIEYPLSVYAPSAFYMLIARKPYKEYTINTLEKKGIELSADEFLKRYPNSGLGALVVSTIGDLGGKKEIKIFRNITKKYKGTPAAISAKLMIKRTKKHMEREKILKERGFKRR